MRTGIRDASERVQTVNTLPDKTVQSDVHRTEIRHILAKYRQVGIVEHMREVDLVYKDVSEFVDFADLMFQSKEAEKRFMGLPSKVREVFDHDVSKWLDAAHDPEKLEALRPQLEKLGVMEPVVAARPLEKRAGPLKGQARERRKAPVSTSSEGGAKQ